MCTAHEAVRDSWVCQTPRPTSRAMRRRRAPDSNRIRQQAGHFVCQTRDAPRAFTFRSSSRLPARETEPIVVCFGHVARELRAPESHHGGDWPARGDSSWPYPGSASWEYRPNRRRPAESEPSSVKLRGIGIAPDLPT